MSAASAMTETASVKALALELEGIDKHFGAFQALKNIHLSVPKGEFVCFLGPSGCGKTTLLRIIAGLEVQTAGTIRQGARDISRLPPAARDYGIVFQSYALFPNLTITDNVAYGLVNRNTPRHEINNRVDELLKLVGLPTSGQKYPGQLSGGQQQRIALARALATSPGLLLLDEPLSALDALERLRLREEIRSLQQRLGVTTIMVTHDQEEALSMADRIVVMNHGVIEQVGTPADIYRQPASPFVADFVGKVNLIEGRVYTPWAGGTQSRLVLGTLELTCPAPVHASVGGTPVRVYLRPEDIVATVAEVDASNVVDALIEKIEFLGAHCMLKVAVEGIPTPLLVTLSPNFLDDNRLTTGSRIALKLLTERMRIFEA